MLPGLYPDGGLLDATRTVQQLLEQPEGLPTVPFAAAITSCECDHKYLIQIIMDQESNVEINICNFRSYSL